ncbi:MAG: DsbA family protein [Gammaproteobacteria bacterium]
MTIKIEYFSDVLCIWAYGGQIRMDELKRDFADEIEIDYRFVPIFGAGKQHVNNVWKDKGGLPGFNAHLKEVSTNWSHISISPNLWTGVAPESSTSAHLYLKAIQLLANHGEIDNVPCEAFNGRNNFEQSIWLFRDVFFRQGKDIARRCIQDEIAEALKLPLKHIHELIDSGQAHAALHEDDEARHSYKVPGSPTLVLNEGRQLLYGNVGYRIIDANVRELLHNPDHGEASWC